MEGMVAVPQATGEPTLKAGALGYLSNLVIGVASTAPGYSLAATLGLVTAVVGFQAPAIMLVAFVPMLFIAASYYWMNRADPDCGTTFAWVTRAMGPRSGWIGGWAIIIADIIVMANLAEIAGLYSFQLFGEANPSTTAVTIVGVVWIAVMTAICYLGTELSAKTQVVLLSAEVITLAVFAVVAIVKVYSGDAPAGSEHIQASWFSPFAIHGTSGLVDGVLLAVFIYWGWDSGVTVNEESENSSRGPGRAAIVSTIVLLLIYVVVSAAAVAFAGPALLTNNSDDVFAPIGKAVLGSGLDKLLIIAVLTSASASTQTTILPTARTSLSMARWGAFPRAFARIHPRFLTPSVATLTMGVVSIVWYVALTIASENVLGASISALGLMIAFYYGLTGFACAVYYRRQLTTNVRNFLFIGVLPVLGGLILLAIFIKSAHDLYLDTTDYGAVGGVGLPFVIGIGGLLLGVILMFLQQRATPEFFRRKPELADPALVARAPAGGA